MRALLLLSLLSLPLHADVLELRDGKKLSGKVSEKGGVYQIKIEGETLTFNQGEVSRWIRKPKELTGEADSLIGEAKKIYLSASELDDEMAMDRELRKALTRVEKARDIYSETRQLFPKGYSEIDNSLVNTMMLMRMIRSRLVTRVTPTAKDYLPTPSKTEPVKPKKKEPPVKPKKKDPVQPPKTKEPVDPPQVNPPALAVPFSRAMSILLDPKKRADWKLRDEARKAWRPHLVPVSFARAVKAFFSLGEEEWGLIHDEVDVKGGGLDRTFVGKLLEKGKDRYHLSTGGRAVVRIWKSNGVWLVRPPGESEIQVREVTIRRGRKSDVAKEFERYLGEKNVRNIGKFEDILHMDAAKSLADSIERLQSAQPRIPVDLLRLFACAHLEAVVEGANYGSLAGEIDETAKRMGMKRAQAGRLWGTSDGLAFHDLQKWLFQGENELGLIHYRKKCRTRREFRFEYMKGILLLLRAVENERLYSSAYKHFETMSRKHSSDRGKKDHLKAMAKSIRAVELCRVCGGTTRIRCRTCFGKGRATFRCSACQGHGKVMSPLKGGLIACRPCEGEGYFRDRKCPTCKKTGKLACRARGCKRMGVRSVPRFEDVATAGPCTMCGGVGSLAKRFVLECRKCFGVGAILGPKSNPSMTID